MNLGHEIGFTRIILLHQLLMRSAVYSTDFRNQPSIEWYSYNFKVFEEIPKIEGTLWQFNMAMENCPFTVDLPIKDGDFP